MQKNLVDLLVNRHWVIVLILLWTLPWKIAALWRSARRKQPGWFLAMIILNTLGILEIFYLFFFSKKEEEKNQQTRTVSPQTYQAKYEIEDDKIEKRTGRKVII